MKVREQTAKPCERKGDRVLGSPLCECLKSCKAQKGYLKDSSKGTQKHRELTVSAFSGCLQLEEGLIEDHLLRYKTREIGGLEVLFEGVEEAQNLNAEIYIDDAPTSVSTYMDFIGDFLTDDRDNDRKLKKGSAFDEGLRVYFPEALGLAQNGLSAFAGMPPENLYESFFESMFVRGDFENSNDDVQQLAACFYHGIDDTNEMKKIWPRYTERRLKETSATIYRMVHRQMPFWAKRFDKIWDKLTKQQSEALKAEWFYDETEKPPQEELAARLDISVASYQERLEWAYKKLEELFPEFRRRRRKNPTSVEYQLQPAAFYEILPNGERVQIRFPARRDRHLSKQEIHEIKRWKFESSLNYLFRYDFYTDVDDEVSETDEEDLNATIEKEHEDYLKLKEDSAKNKG